MLNALTCCRSGMKSWPCLQRREQHRVKQTSPLQTHRRLGTSAGTWTFLLSAWPLFPTLLMAGSRREEISSTWVENVKRVPPVNTTHRYLQGELWQRLFVCTFTDASYVLTFQCWCCVSVCVCVPICCCAVGVGHIEPCGLCQAALSERGEPLGDVCLCILPRVTRAHIFPLQKA